MGNQQDEYVPAGPAATLFKISPKTIARWSKEGKLPSVVTLGGHRRYSRRALNEIAASLGYEERL